VGDAYLFYQVVAETINGPVVVYQALSQIGQSADVKEGYASDQVIEAGIGRVRQADDHVPAAHRTRGGK
jgi:hypothetical protein